MLAKKNIPQQFLDWNLEHGAPFGRDILLAKKLRRWLPSSWYWKLRGPFAVQRNNSTRAFEYPWVFQQLKLAPGMKVVDVGGGLSGFQFVLSSQGCQVVNVDPGMGAAGRGWPCDQRMMSRLNSCFGTNVQLHNTTMDKADIDAGSVDAVLSISVIEHLPWEDVVAVMNKAWKVLKPGGRFILTVDLFPDIVPFDEPLTNKYGSNINLKDLIEIKPFKLLLGNEHELFGFDEFDSAVISNRRHDYLLGSGYPAMVQCLVLAKPAYS